MQVTELAAEGLKRAFTVVVPATEIAAARDQRLATLAKDIRLPGFRPGKVPMSVVKQRYGSAVMGEVLEEQVQSVTKTVIDERGLRPAMQPKIELVNFAEGADLEFKVELEQLPEIPLPDFAAIALEKPVAKVGDDEVTKALTGIASRNRAMEDVTEDRPAAVGDVVMADFSGRVKGGANLLPEPVVSGDALPEGWALTGGLQLGGLSGGSDAQGAWIDLKLTGDVGGNAALALGPVVPAKAGDQFALSLRAAVVEGALPGDLAAKLDLSERGANGVFLHSTLSDLPLSGETPAAASVSLTVREGDTVTGLRPFLRFNGRGTVALTLRIWAPVLTDGALQEPFPGGTGTDMAVEIGGTGFIPGFAEGLEGIRTGETRNVDVVFPAEYGAAELAGKAAVFEITAKGLKKPVDAALDDDFAKKLGLASLDELKTRITETLQQEYDQLSRMNVKRKLLDALSAQASFEVPEGMVEAEFAQIWQRVESDMKAGNLDADDKGKDEDTLKADYRAIAERRIRLGLLLSEIGRSNNIQVANEELSRAMRTEAGRYPGQERQVMEFFQKNPQAIENLRAPLFEEKVVDFMLELAQVTEKEVPAAELSADPAA
jgi:FKBP-type peptidyl-prolyl cis-trans isomerase (trigger factor)